MAQFVLTAFFDQASSKPGVFRFVVCLAYNEFPISFLLGENVLRKGRILGCKPWIALRGSSNAFSCHSRVTVDLTSIHLLMAPSSRFSRFAPIFALAAIAISGPMQLSGCLQGLSFGMRQLCHFAGCGSRYFFGNGICDSYRTLFRYT